MKKFTKNLFKVLFLTLVSVSLMITTSCSDDDDGSSADPIIGTWTLYELVTPAGTFNTTVLSTLGYSMTVVFTADSYTANGNVFDMTINESGTWTRQDANTVIISTVDGDQTLTKSGDYYTADFGDGATGKFKKQ